jgi:hypothetical protein
MPIVSLDAMRQAYFRDGKAKYGDIIWWPKGNAWKNQSLTPNVEIAELADRPTDRIQVDGIAVRREARVAKAQPLR